MPKGTRTPRWPAGRGNMSRTIITPSIYGGTNREHRYVSSRAKPSLRNDYWGYQKPRGPAVISGHKKRVNPNKKFGSQYYKRDK